ncbi:MAG: phosphoenolpyruvate carboxylase, partial [Actinobacteria bacterium]|nr:phosphoenolpyruvate carboxylase [Actinomycetota bacterium]
MSAEDQLRLDIRRLGNQLGDALVRQHGQDLLDLVEDVRKLGKSSRRGGSGEAGAELDTLLANLSIDEVIPLVRAFTAYFYLANVAEQVHRIDQMAPDERYLAATVDRIIASDPDDDILIEILSRLEVRPVFTAHPTEAARRSVLSKTIRLARLIEQRFETDETELQAQIDRKTTEIIDQIWQTDELRQDRPSPVEEARSALYYLSELASEVMPDLSERISHELSRLGAPVDPTPIRFGTWVGGDRDGNPA